MPILQTALRDQDLGFLQIIASLWGIRITRRDVGSARQDLLDELLDAELVEEVVNALPQNAREALNELMQHTGRLPWARFSQKHGLIRQMGQARRDRDRPWENGPSPVEMLYYRGLIALAFMESTDGLQEFAYIPDDLLGLIPPLKPLIEQAVGRPAADQDCAQVREADDSILDDLTTILAALRSSRSFEGYVPAQDGEFFTALLRAADMVDETGDLDVEQVRIFLERPRGEALAALCRSWISSPTLYDLHLVPTLEVEGAWVNDVLRTRRNLIDILQAVPADTWWSLPGFIAAIKEHYPEFQRPDGDFDSWFLKRRDSDKYLRGVEYWDEVEGALIRWIIVGPLFRLGIVDLAGKKPLKTKEHPAFDWPLAFRLTRWAPHLLKGIPLDRLADESEKVHVRSDGRINVPRLAPRAARYLLARFSDWEAPVMGEYRYRPTPSSLSAAAEHGLNIGQLIALLARHTDGIPPNVTRALKNWQIQGMAARIETYPVLRLPSAEALDALRNSRAARFLGDTLGPAAVGLKPGTEKSVLAVLSELGYLGEILDTK